MSQYCVSHVAEKVKVSQSLKNVLGQDRKRLTSERDDWRLLQLCKADRTTSTRQLHVLSELSFQIVNNDQSMQFVDDC